jgi:nucleoid-associated protein YgaU
MDRLEQLKQKYASVLRLIQGSNVRLAHLHVQDDKLFVQGAAPNQEIKNQVWDEIKRIDPGYADLTCDLSIDPSIPAPAAAPAASEPAAQTYTVQPGDSLSKISKHFYGDANQYMKIFEANRDRLSDPNRIQVGQRLVIPPA